MKQLLENRSPAHQLKRARTRTEAAKEVKAVERAKAKTRHL